MRIVSLTCSNTEIVCALGRADWLVGVDDHSDFPVDVVTSLPRVGKDLNVDPRKVAALNPDLVLASLTVPGHEKVVQSLREAELPVVVLAPRSIEDTYADIRKIGEMTAAKSAATALVEQMRSAIEEEPSGVLPRPRILVEWWPRPVIGAAAQSWVQDLLHAAGAENLLADRDCESTPLTDDEVRRYAPDALIISWCGVPTSHYRSDVVYRRKGWQDVPAVKNGHVFCIPEAYLGRPGPRLVDGVRALRDVVSRLQK